MPLADRDIIITPNRGQSLEPNIAFRGADAASSATVTLRVYNSSTVGTVSFEGNAGQLMSVVDSLSGTIFSVNDISGMPSMEILDTGEIRLAQYSGFVNILSTATSTSTNTGVLRVAGGVGIGGNIAIGGALYAGGTTGTNGQILTSTGNGISWTTLSSSFNGGTINSPLIINNSTGASSTNTGALQITNGGAGIGGGLVVGGISTITNTIEASSTNTGALQVRGGVGIGGKLYAGLDGYFNAVTVGRGAGSIVSNTVLGNGALDSNTTGTNNLALGYLSLNSNQTGANNVAVGYETMFGTTNAFADTALGARALQNVSSGQYNIGIGYNAGNSITTGNGNTIIGSVSGTAGLSDTVIIAAGTTERIRVDGSNLYINGTIFTGGSGGITQGQVVAISMGLAMP